MNHNEKYYLVNCDYEGFDTIAEGDEIIFTMPPFCSGDYRATVMKDEKGLFIPKRNNFLQGCRDYEIVKKK